MVSWIFFKRKLTMLDKFILCIVSLAFVFQPIGSALSGMVTKQTGRKRALILMNVLFLISWIFMYLASQNFHFYMATSINGLAQGLVEAPMFAYGSEIW